MVKKRLTYKVQRGDDYTKIADRLYGDKRYRTALMKQNPHVKKVSPGVVINLLDDDPKEMWKKRERGRRRQSSLRKKNWENFKRALGINPDLSEIEPTPITIQPPAPPEPTTWWEDPAFQEGLIGLVESTAESMGLDANVMLEELGLGEGSPLLAEAPSTGQAQPQTGSPPSTTPTMTDEQKKALKKELGEMGLDADVAMEELGLGEGAASSTTATQPTDTGVDGGDDGKDRPSGKVARPAEPDEPTPTPTPEGTYTVQEGDTLWEISQETGISISELKRMNNLTSDIIYPGQVLDVSNSQLEEPQPTPTSTPQIPTDELVEKVKKIAKEMELDANVMLEELGLADYIKPRGQKASFFNDIPPYGETIVYPDYLGIVSREEWGAKDVLPDGELETGSTAYQVYDKPLTDVYNTIYVHDTGFLLANYGNQTNVEIMQHLQEYHQGKPEGEVADESGMGLVDTGYHYVVFPDGEIMVGRDIRARGAHVDPIKENGKYVLGNTGAIGIALVGDFSEGDEITQEQKEALNELVTFLVGDLPKIGCIAGHGDVNAGKEFGQGSKDAELVSNLADNYGLTISGRECYESPD